MSGVNVPRTKRSQSRAVRPVLANRSVAASTHRSEVAWCGAACRRSRMPVRLTIQSESNPSRACRWSLPTTMSGTYLPVPTTRTPIRDRHFGRGRGRWVLIGSTSAREPARSAVLAVGGIIVTWRAGAVRPPRNRSAGVRGYRPLGGLTAPARPGPSPLGPAVEEPDQPGEGARGGVDPQVAVGRGQVEPADEHARP